MKSIKRLTESIVAASLLLAVAVAGNSVARLPEEISVSKSSGANFADIPYVSITADGTETAPCSSGAACYDADVRLLGFITVGKINVKPVADKRVILSGRPFGVKFQTDGAFVIAEEKVNGKRGPAVKAGIKTGDVIKAVNGIDVKDASMLTEQINTCKGKTLEITVQRDEKCFSLSVRPEYDTLESTYKLGVWVRDNTAGIGIMTYIDPESGCFAGLGHPICDDTCGEVMPVGSGSISDVCLTGVRRGVSGSPGELSGFLCDDCIGTLKANCETGVYGIYDMPYTDGETIRAAMKQEVKEGDAKLLTTLPGKNEPTYYDISIEKIYYDDLAPTRNMVIKVRDKRLLDTAGGIVQGMSGSPIVQNGIFVGAVTHVFVNDPTKGYAIFAENMLDSTRYVSDTTNDLT